MPLATRPHLVRRRSLIAGYGVFAGEHVPRRAWIVTYDGELISQAESARREARHLPAGRVWCFNVNRRWVRDASAGGNVARFINHACRPNCFVQIVRHAIWIRAARAIAEGEELTYDYATEGAAGIACRCRPACRTVL